MKAELRIISLCCWVVLAPAQALASTTEASDSPADPATQQEVINATPGGDAEVVGAPIEGTEAVDEPTAEQQGPVEATEGQEAPTETPGDLLLAEETLPAACQPGTWELKGADWRVGEDCSFHPDWMPVLEDIAACMSHSDVRLACVQVQGRFDELLFQEDIVRAYGGRLGAQAARSRARSSRVSIELMKLGVEGRRVVEMTPPAQSSYRGAHLELVPNCVPELFGLQTTLAPAQLEAAVRAVVDEELRASGEVGGQENHLWLYGSVSGGMLASETNASAETLLQMGGGWSNDFLYGFADVGFELGSEAEQRVGLEVTARAGYITQRWPWLEVGLAGGGRVTTSSGGSPWLEQFWFVGLESSQCLFSLWEGNETCIRETLVPAGVRIRRGEVANVGPRRIATKYEPAFRFDVGLVTRHDLLSGGGP